VQILLTLLVEKFECLKKFRPAQNEDPHQVTNGESKEIENENKIDCNNNEQRNSAVNLFKIERNVQKKNSLVELSISSKKINNFSE